MTTTTIYPTTDGYVMRNTGAGGSGVDWSTLRDGNGTDVQLSANNWCGCLSDNVTDKFLRIYRAILVFDTSSIPAGDVISAVTLKLNGFSKQDTFTTPAAPDSNVYDSGASGTDDQILAGDYQLCGTTAYCDTPITYANWDTNAGRNNTFAFNAAGIAAINTSGYTRIAFRNANYDVADVAPTWSSVKSANHKADDDESGTERPELEIVHAPPSFIPRITIIT